MAWTLPPALAEGYALDPVEATIRSDMEAGAARVRRTSAARHDQVKISWLFGESDMAGFRAWWEGSVMSGAAWFFLQLATGGDGIVSREARFVGRWQAALLPGLRWKVSATVETRPYIPTTFELLNGLGLPSLDFQFAAVKSLTSVVTHDLQTAVTVAVARNCPQAAYYDSAGLLKFAAANAPRWDHDPDTLVSRGLLIEEARTNLLLNSNNFGAWIQSGTCTAVQNVTGPDGVSNSAWTLTDADATAYTGRYQTVAVAANTASYTFALRVKKTSGGTAPLVGINLSFAGGTGSVSATPRLNTDTGQVYNGGASARSRGAWWEFQVAITNNGTHTSLQAVIYPATSLNQSVTSDNSAGVGSIVIYGAQLEQATIASSYIPTTTAPVQRVADVVTATVSAAWFNAAAGTLVVSGDTQKVTSQSILVALNAGATYGAGNGFLVRVNSPTTISAGGYSSETTAAISPTLTAGASIRAAASYSGTACSVAANGGVPGSMNTLDFTGVGTTKLLFGALETTNLAQSAAPCHIARLTYYPQARTDLQALAA